MCRYLLVSFLGVITPLSHFYYCWVKTCYSISHFYFFFWCQHIEPYGAGRPEQNDCSEKKINPSDSYSSEKVGSGIRSTSSFCCRSPDYGTKEIKTIYVDCKFFPDILLLEYCNLFFLNANLTTLQMVHVKGKLPVGSYFIALGFEKATFHRFWSGPVSKIFFFKIRLIRHVCFENLCAWLLANL